MTSRVFLSWAVEDQSSANSLVEALTGAGLQIGGRLSEIAAVGSPARDAIVGIADADAFVILLSPYYLASPACRMERNIAIQRELDLDQPFVHVVIAAETPYSDTGPLGDYDWLDGRPPLDATKLAEIAAALRPGAPRGDGERPASDFVATMPRFRNRDDELGSLTSALTTRGGRDLWTVVSPPRLGKSWLLDQLPYELATRDPRWSARLLDVREHPLEIRRNPSILVSRLFDVDVDVQPDNHPLPADDIRRIATAVIARQRPQVYLLDSAHLLTSDCAIHTRSALTAIYRTVQQSGSRDLRLSLVVGTRRYDDWRGLGLDPRVGLRFEPLWLTAFQVVVVQQALAELAGHLDEEQRWYCAQRLHRLSEGLPALLVPSLRWAARNDFLVAHQAEGDGALDEIASVYVERDLLSAESLLAAGAQDPDRAVEVLHEMLRVLSAYRFFTQSHIHHHVELDPAVKASLTGVRWSETELWDALSQTSICDQLVTELWQVIEPPIRRLLYRYYHRTKAEQIRSHTECKQFYEGWTAIRGAGREQPVVLIECLWHEASRMVLQEPEAVPHSFAGIATELTYKFANSPIYAAAEFAAFVEARLRDDKEFQLLFQNYDGLFDEVVKSVVRTVNERR